MSRAPLLAFGAAGLVLAAANASRPSPEVAAEPAIVVDPAPPPRAETCDEVADRVVAAVGTPDAALADADRDALFHDARLLGTAPDAARRACRARIFAALRGQEECGRAEAAVAGGLAVAGGVEPRDLADLVREAAPGCAATFAEASAFAADVDASLADALLDRARTDSDESVRRSAWLAYGSVAEVASRTGKDALRVAIEATVARELTRAKGAARLLAVQTAGNAGCRPCLAELVALSETVDVELRRNAVAALRFLDDGAAVRAACRAAVSDHEPSVRDLATWGLSFRDAHPTLRVRCLDRAAREDRSARVRASAVRSLASLSDAVAPAYAALVALTEDAPADVRDLAARHLATDPEHGRRDVGERAFGRDDER